MKVETVVIDKVLVAEVIKRKGYSYSVFPYGVPSMCLGHYPTREAALQAALSIPKKFEGVDIDKDKIIYNKNIAKKVVLFDNTVSYGYPGAGIRFDKKRRQWTGIHPGRKYQVLSKTIKSESGKYEVTILSIYSYPEYSSEVSTPIGVIIS